MSFMTESLLLQAQSLRLEGDHDASINLLRAVLSQCNSDIEHATDKNERNATWQMRQMAVYQLALLLLQRRGRKQYNSINDGDVVSGATEVDARHSNDEGEADELLWKLGYQLRVSTSAFGYPTCCCRHADTYSEMPLHIIDDAIPSEFFEGLQMAFRSGSEYWTEFYSKVNSNGVSSWKRNVDSLQPAKNQFASHNITLPYPPIYVHLSYSLQHAGSLMEQVAIIVQHRLLNRFPVLKDARSVEVWCHQRPPDGSHQLHYDLDEIRLQEKRNRLLMTNEDNDFTTELQHETKRQKMNASLQSNDVDNVMQLSEQNKDDGIYCPLVSCVLTINVPNNQDACHACGETSKAAPTIVSSQSITNPITTQSNLRNAHENGKGWLCYPKPNRLLAFDGSLLHGVMPGIPEPGSDEESFSSDASSDNSLPEDNEGLKRVTLMLGFWAEGVCKQLASNIGPNMPFPQTSNSDNQPHSWAKDFVPVKLKDGECADINSHVTTYPAIEVNPIWTEIHPKSNAKCGEFSGQNEDAIQFSGRFFLKSCNAREIDDEIVHLTRI